MKHQKRWIAVVSVLLVLTLAFIWRNSMESIPESQAKSLDLVAILKPIMEPIIGEGKVTDHFVRKTAHFCEFALLGAELRLLFLLLGFGTVQGHMNALFAALAAGVTDETIQYFYDRGSMVLDVVLDFCGAFFGALVLLLIALGVRHRKKRRE